MRASCIRQCLSCLHFVKSVFFSFYILSCQFFYTKQSYTKFLIVLLIIFEQRPRDVRVPERNSWNMHLYIIYCKIMHPFSRSEQYKVLNKTTWKQKKCMWNITARYIRKRTFAHVRQAKIQISLRIRAVWSESSLGTFWIANMQNVFMRTLKTLIRLRGCAGWSKSSLGAHDKEATFSHVSALRVQFIEINYLRKLCSSLLRIYNIT